MYKRKVSTQPKFTKCNYPIIGLYTTLKFGKYKYLTIKQVLDKDNKYILWCIDNFVFKPNHQLVTELIDRQLISRYDSELNIIYKILDK